MAFLRNDSLNQAVVEVSKKQWMSLGKDLLNRSPKTMFSLNDWNHNRYYTFSTVLDVYQERLAQTQLVDLLCKTLGKNHKLTLATEEFFSDNHSGHQLHQLAINESFEKPVQVAKNQNCDPTVQPRTQKKIFCLVFSVLVIFLVMSLSAIAVGPLYTSSTSSESVTRVAGGDTVMVNVKRSFFFGSFHVAQCEQRGDYSHIADMAVVKTAQLIKRKWSQNIVRQMEEPAGSRYVGLLSNITYLLPGAELNYEICLESGSVAESTAVVYVFDDPHQFTNYLLDENDQVSSIASFQVQIGANNNSICSWIRFTIDHPGYYYVAGETPVSLTYFMNSTLQSDYYNGSDYSSECSVSDVSDCDLKIPGGFFSNEEYTLLASARQSAVSDPPFTHLCVSATRSVHVTAIMIAAGCISFLGCLLLSVVVGVQVFKCFYSSSRRRGYSKL